VKLAIIVPILDEAMHLPTFLASLAAQERHPDQLLLVDDGSHDTSAELADGFAAVHPFATVVRLAKRPPARDRLARANELLAFTTAIEMLDDGWDVVAKLDADLDLPPSFFATIERSFSAHPELGVGGAYLSVRRPDGLLLREHCPPYHVRGGSKFYRRACFEDISPIPPILGWDTIDEVAARRHGWRTASFEMPGRDPIHLRPTGSGDGVLRGYARWGTAAYAIGYHPLWLLAGAARRLGAAPRLLGSAWYLYGWARAALVRHPRAERADRDQVRGEQLGRLRALVRARRLSAAAAEGTGLPPRSLR
jgi:glycosyltransferase involved in cell wall biosynthesis